ncbi:MAG: type II secretion system protein J [Candidatus Xenobiia bacterium LiM19]
MSTEGRGNKGLGNMRISGFTLVEMIVSAAMFLVMMTLLFGGYSVFMKYFRISETKNEVHRKFVLMSSDFRRESLRTVLDTVLFGSSAGNDWICFKSNLDSDDNPHYNEEGFPLWQKYILYYTVRPSNDRCCKAGSDTDDICPHKYIIKKTIDIAASIVDETGVIPYLTFTLTRDQAKSEPNVVSVKPVIDGVLGMRGGRDSSRVYMHLKMVRLQEACRYLQIGAVSLSDAEAKRFVNEFLLSSIPKNYEP